MFKSVDFAGAVLAQEPVHRARRHRHADAVQGAAHGPEALPMSTSRKRLDRCMHRRIP
ncbi:MAG: hypothetical protein U1E17_04370 [Geminicoccaceae bacterium]